MIVTSKTTSALLEGLLQPEADEVWCEFDRRYRPVIVGLAQKFGLMLADAEDVAQETLTRFVKHYRLGKYDRERGRLRSWLIGIARRCIVDALRARARRRERRGESAIAGVPSADEMEGLWEAECQRAIMSRALEELHDSSRADERTLRAFEAVAFDQRPAQEVARELNMSVDSVYHAKSRCTKRLRSIVTRLKEAYQVE